MFQRWRHRKDLRLFEMGLGTNNPGLPSSMGPRGVPGASLRGWSEYFPFAEIVGADIDRDILFDDADARIKTYWCDQTDESALEAMWKKDDGMFDIIVDDGLHTFRANKTMLLASFHRLKPGGVYVVEDLNGACDLAFAKCADLWENLRGMGMVASRIVRLEHPCNNVDNILLVAIKQ